MTQLALVVDDDGDQRTLLRGYLERQGFEVLEAEDGDEALTLLESSAPALIVLDLQMPIVGGLEFMKLRDAQGLAPTAELIVCSGTSPAGVPTSCYFFSKPVPRAAFSTLVRDLRERMDAS